MAAARRARERAPDASPHEVSHDRDESDGPDRPARAGRMQLRFAGANGPRGSGAEPDRHLPEHELADPVQSYARRLRRILELLGEHDPGPGARLRQVHRLRGGGLAVPGGVLRSDGLGDPRPGAGTCPLPPPSTYTGLFANNTISARTQVKVECPGELEGEYTFNQI